MSSNYESVFDNDSVRIKLADTEDGIALSLDLMDGGESTAGTTLYLGQEQIDGVCAWLEKYRSARPEALHTERVCSRGGKHEIDQCHKCGGIFNLEALRSPQLRSQEKADG